MTALGLDVTLGTCIDPAVLLTADGEELARNAAAEGLCAGRRLLEILTDDSWTKLLDAVGRPRAGIEVVTTEGATFDVHAVATERADVALLALRDVSRYTSAAEKLAAVTAELSRRNRDLATLYEVSAQLGSTLNLAEIGEATCQLVGEYIGAHAVAVEIADQSHTWPGRRPTQPPDGTLAIETSDGSGGQLLWWRPSALAPSERRLIRLIVGRAAIGFENAILHAAVERQAEHDALTGLLNRAGVERLLPTVAYPAAVAILDLDNFKQVNDRFGHETGDDVLIRFAASLTHLRATEVVARWGGEEFLVVWPATEPGSAGDALDRLRARVAETIHVGGAPVTFSAGVAALPDGAAFASAVASADTALYLAKRRGRNRIRLAPDAAGPEEG